MEIPEGQKFTAESAGSDEKAALANAMLKASDPEKQAEITGRIHKFIVEAYREECDEDFGGFLANYGPALILEAKASMEILTLMHAMGMWTVE